MAREPELSIKVKVDPQINPSNLKTNIERQVKQSGEKPKVEIDPNVDGIKGKIEEKLKNVKATATVTPIVDTEKIKTDIQRQINGISDMPKVTVGVDVNNFSNELSEQLKTQLKEVNQQLSYYLKNLTTNTTSLNDVTKNLFVDSNFAERLQKQVDEVKASFNALKSDLGESNSFFDNIFARTDLKSFNDFQIKIAKLKKELEPLYGDDSILADPKTKLYDSTAIKKYFEDVLPDVQEFVQLLNNISYVPKNTKLLKELGISQEEMKKTLADAQVMYNVITKIRNYAEAGNFNADKYNLSEQIENIISKAYDANDIDIEDFENLFQGVVNNISNVSKLVSDRLEEVADKKRKVLESDDKSRIGGYDESRIKKISDTYLEALSAFTNQQNVLNKAKAATIKLDDTLLAKASAHAKAIKNQAGDIQKIYGFVSDDILNSKKSKVVDSKNGDAKNTNSVESNFVITNVDFKIDPAVLQAKVDALFNGISAPISKVTITDADITVDIKNPVKIPSVAVIDSSTAQVSNTDDLKASADALASANKSLNGIASKTDRYVSNISALGPAFQYVAQEVDNLSHSLENQIIDFDRISEQTNAYIGKAGSISIDTSNVAVTGELAAITGKVVLGTEDVVPPETPVDIKGHVKLETTDITPPSEPVELQSKISKTTMESATKGKKKKGQDIEKPEVVELNGHVKLEDKDIERPDPVKFNGAVKIKDSDIKIGDIEISKKKFDINGNLILKNAEIANAIKEAAGKESGKKDAPTTEATAEKEKLFNRAGKEAHLGWLISARAENRANWQTAYSNGDKNTMRWLKKQEESYIKDFDETTRELVENLTDAERDQIEKINGKKIKWDDSKEIDDLIDNGGIEWPWEASGAYINGIKKYDSIRTRYNAGAADALNKSNSYEKEYVNLVKERFELNQNILEMEKQYGQFSEPWNDAVSKKQKNTEAINQLRKQYPSLPYSKAVRSAYLENDQKYKEARAQTFDSNILKGLKNTNPKKVLSDVFNFEIRNFANKIEEASKYENSDVSKEATEAREEMQKAATRVKDAFIKLYDILSGDELESISLKAQKELAQAQKKADRNQASILGSKNSSVSRVKFLNDQLSDAQKTYGTAEDAEAADKIPTSIQEALRTQQQLITAIANTTVGTEEYNNAIKAAEDNWKNVAAAIDASNKAQKSLSNQTNTLLRKFELLKEEASQSSNDELKNGIEGIITRARDLNAKDPSTYENYANDLLQLRQDSYAVQAKHTLWRKGYKGLEKKGTQIAQGVEVARQMQEDGSLQDIDFKNIDELIAKLNTLSAQSDTYAETLKEIDILWQEIKKQVDAVNESEKQAAKKQTAKIRDVKNILTAQRQNKNLIETVRGNNGSGEEFYSQLSEKQSKLNLLFEAIDGASDSEQALKAWASQNLKESADNINSVTDAIRTLDKEYNDAQSSAESFNRTISQERSTNKAATEVANLIAQIHDYLETNKKIQGSELAQPFRDLQNALNSETAPEKIGELKKQFAELRARSKELGLETESLIDKFEKLFGTHLSTMITMAALHKMQEALRLVYQNVVEIDTAVTELRKVSEYAGKSLEEYMSRAAKQAQKLGVSISDYVNSTADWKRLGYSDEDAENLATYSTLLRNVGDGIDDVNTSSSYLISTLKGFGLLASDAEDVVDKIDAVANTQPVTANDLGEILTRSSAAMSAANNTLEETIALGTAANSVIQDADSVGTMMKSLSMYLRAAKTEADAAGESTEGMADSVSKLRTELKSLTGVDIMLDSKNFKSTYQIMKELSQVWGSLSDVTQANVTEMIAGKRNANGVAAILNNFDIAESTMESAANSANVAWEENEKYLDSIQGRLAQLDASFQVLSTDVLSSDLVKSGVSFLTSIVKFLDKIINLTGALPAGLGIAAFATQLGEPKMTGFMIVPSNTPGGDTEQACGVYYIKCCSAREYLVKPTNMAA